jgi:putative addiction module component (TIGR02574 family)
MSFAELSRSALELPPQERLELARRMVESVVSPEPVGEPLAQGIRRLDDLLSGRVEGLTEEQFRDALR